MKNKVNKNFKAETEEEIKIENYLNALYGKEEINDFVGFVKKEAEQQEPLFKYKSRIKSVNSAIRTYRLNNKTLEQVHDYLGISIITNNQNEIYPIVNHLKEKIPEGEFVDFLAEENIYSPVLMEKWAPPLSFHIMDKKSLISDKMDVPIEIRICSKEGYIAEQAPYYTVRKNDEIKISDEVRGKMLMLMQHVTYKLALITVSSLSAEDKNKQKIELQKIIDNNKDFLKENNELCQETIFDFGMLTYKCTHNKEFTEDENKLSADEIDIIDEKIRNSFANVLESNSIEAICDAVEKTKVINYCDIKK